MSFEKMRLHVSASIWIPICIIFVCVEVKDRKIKSKA